MSREGIDDPGLLASQVRSELHLLRHWLGNGFEPGEEWEELATVEQARSVRRVVNLVLSTLEAHGLRAAARRFRAETAPYYDNPNNLGSYAQNRCRDGDVHASPFMDIIEDYARMVAQVRGARPGALREPQLDFLRKILSRAHDIVIDTGGRLKNEPDLGRRIFPRVRLAFHDALPDRRVRFHVGGKDRMPDLSIPKPTTRNARGAWPSMSWRPPSGSGRRTSSRTGGPRPAGCLDGWEPLRGDAIAIRTLDNAAAARFVGVHVADRHVRAFERCRHPAIRKDRPASMMPH